jgi:AcrR family transcriptional regulator
VEAALALVDQDGLPALTIRRLATELGVAPMSLYSHVAGKAELVAVMVDDVVGRVADDGRDTGDWEADLRSLCRRHRLAWARHRGLVRAYVDGVPPGPNTGQVTTRFVEVLQRSGLPADEAGDAFRALREYTIGSLLMDDTPEPGVPYEFGLDLLVAGIRDRAERRSPDRDGRRGPG